MFDSSPDDHSGEGAPTEGVDEDHGSAQLVALAGVVHEDNALHGDLNHANGGPAEGPLGERHCRLHPLERFRPVAVPYRLLDLSHNVHLHDERHVL